MKTQLKRTGFLSVAVVLLLLLLAGTLLAAGETIARYSPGGGSGGGTSSNGTTTIRSAFGQPIIGVVGNENTTLCSGVACGMGVKSDEPISGLLVENDGPTVLGNPTGFSASVVDGTGISYAWDYGDGATGSGPNPSHVYGAVGSYTVTVIASNGAGTETAQTTVEVSNSVVEVRNFEFAPENVTIPQGGRVTWVRTAGTHNVKADDGSFTSGAPDSTWETYSRTFDSQGTYPYYCELHGGPGGTGMSGTVTVTESSDSSITGLTAANDGPTLLGSPTSLNATVATGSNIIYSWDYGDGTTGSGPNPSHVYGTAGTYVATVTATNSQGSTSASTTVEVSHAIVDVLNHEFLPQSVTIRPGDRVTWVRIEGNHNVQADDGSFTSGPPGNAWRTFTQTFTEVGTYPYFCLLHGSAGGFGMAGTVVVEASSDSSIGGLTAGNDGPTVLGSPTTLSAGVTSGSNVTYSWDYGDGTTGSGMTAQHTYAESGIYLATVTASNTSGSESASTTVIVSHAVVEVRNFEYVAQEVSIPSGGSVTWVRIEGNHNVRADDDSFTSGAPNDTWTTYTRSFTSAGTYPYYCELHGGPGGTGMSGVVEVTPESSSGSESEKTYLPFVTRGR